jgi:hypothetical protein
MHMALDSSMQLLEHELIFLAYADIYFISLNRFELLHEENIEYSKLDLRDNVAQICVLEVYFTADNIFFSNSLCNSN